MTINIACMTMVAQQLGGDMQSFCDSAEKAFIEDTLSWHGACCIYDSVVGLCVSGPPVLYREIIPLPAGLAQTCLSSIVTLAAVN